MLEVIPPFEADDARVLDELRESVAYWSRRTTRTSGNGSAPERLLPTELDVAEEGRRLAIAARDGGLSLRLARGRGRLVPVSERPGSRR